MIPKIYPTREAWLASRDPLSIGASEAAMALGVSPYGGPWDLYERKHGAIQPDSPQMARGRKWEARVLEDYAEAAEVQIVDPAIHFSGKPGIVTMAHSDFPWLRCSPDSLSRSNGVLGGVEAKTATDAGAWTPEKGMVLDRWTDDAATMIPAHYAVQVYVSLEISGLPYWDLCALVPAAGWLEVRWVRVMRDTATQGQILEALADWQGRHLAHGEPPPIDGSGACNRHLSASFQKRPAREATGDELASLTEYAALKAQIKSLEDRSDLLKNQLIQISNGARLLANSGKGAPYGQPQFNQGKTGIDTEKLKAEFPEAWAACQKQGAPFTTFNLYKFSKE
jgi:predicted phage-related endonuclease